MDTVLLTVGLMAGLMGVMAVGVILGRKPLKGSCGGTGGSCACAEARRTGACKRKLEADAEPEPEVLLTIDSPRARR